MENRNSHKKYKEGKASFGKAKEIADISPWCLQEIFNKEKIQISYNKTDLKDDLEQINRT